MERTCSKRIEHITVKAAELKSLDASGGSVNDLPTRYRRWY